MTKFEKMINELKNKIEELNNDEDFGVNKTKYYIYDYSLEENKYLIDYTEDSYYDEWLLKPFDKIVERYGYFLECICPGRYLIAK